MSIDVDIGKVLEQIRLSVTSFGNWVTSKVSKRHQTLATEYFNELKVYLEEIEKFIKLIDDASKLNDMQKKEYEAILIKIKARLAGLDAIFKLDKPSWGQVKKLVSEFAIFLLGPQVSTKTSNPIFLGL